MHIVQRLASMVSREVRRRRDSRKWEAHVANWYELLRPSDLDDLHVRLGDQGMEEMFGLTYTRIPPSASSLSDADIIRRNADLSEILLSRRPSSIVELGSGRTSIVLGSFAKRTGASLDIFEGDANWAARVASTLQRLALPGTVHACEEVDIGRVGRRYNLDLPAETDFIYLDGPSGISDIRFKSIGHKGYCLDVVHAFELGRFPQTIVVDGRVDTVLLFEALSAARHYEIEYGFPVGQKLQLPLPDTLSLRRHSVFTLCE